MTITFEDVIPPDVVPDLADVEYPCEVCGQEAGPYVGRGRKPKRCPVHKRSTSRTTTPRVAGKDANLAAQATGVLVQVNSMLALGIAALGFFQTGSSINQANETFEQAAYQALLTDPDFCKAILRGGAKSAKLSLAIAYGGMGLSVVPTMMEELRERKAEKAAKDAANVELE